MVYFITDGELVKIGKADDAKLRLKGLQTGNPKKLKLLLELDGSYEMEALLHELFIDYRVRGEWFKLTNESLDRFKINIDKYNDDADKILKYINARVEFNRNVRIHAPSIMKYIFNKISEFNTISSHVMMNDLDINIKIIKDVLARFKISEHIRIHNLKVDQYKSR